MVEATGETTGAVPPGIPVSGEVATVEGDLEPPAAELDPAGSKVSTQEEERTTLAGGSQIAPKQASPGEPSPTIRPLRLVGEPLLKLRRSTR